LRTSTTAAAILVMLLGATWTAHGQPASPSVSPPLTYRAALDLATQRNLSLAAAQRQRAIRDAQVKTAGQIENPNFLMEVSRDIPHEVVSVDFPLGFGAKRARRVELAKEELTLADLDVRIETRILRRNLRQGFYGLLAADNRVRLAEEVLAVSERGKQAAQARFEEGAAPKLDMMQADLWLARARAELDLALSARATAQADLNAVLNQPPAQALTLAGQLSDVPALPGFEAAMSLAATSNVDLLAAERDLAIEQRRIALLRAERIPTPAVTLGAVINAPGEFKVGAFGGLSVAVPLFSRNQGEIAQSLAVSEEIRARHEAVRRTVENNMFGAVARLDAGRKQAETYGRTLFPTAKAILDLAEESYRLGRSSVLAVLEAQRTFRDVSREYVQSLLDLQMAIADLEEIIGAPIQ
jgi:cobalt-zinc-cadmium efflux system outer membrane protein